MNKQETYTEKLKKGKIIDVVKDDGENLTSKTRAEKICGKKSTYNEVHR